MEAPHNSLAAEADAGTAPGTVTVDLAVESPEQMQALGRRIAAVLRPGDLVMLSGELGAGKTTLTRGLGEGLGVRGAVTSPTFVIARVHPSLTGGPALVHVDAYRLGGGLDEMEDWTSTCRCRSRWWSWSGATARSRNCPRTGST